MKIGKLFLYFLGFVILGVMIDEGGAGLYTGENTLLWYLNNLLETKIYCRIKIDLNHKRSTSITFYFVIFLFALPLERIVRLKRNAMCVSNYRITCNTKI